jgi:diguanylate cyclase
MEGKSLKSRAFTFAAMVGATAFFLSLLASGANAMNDSGSLTRALVVSIICGTFGWASAERATAMIAQAIDAAVARVVGAAEGDLTSPTPKEVAQGLPQLSKALDGLFDQVRSNIESVHALAMFDPVTSLANRTNFRREADRALRQLDADGTAALFFIDLDNFKAVNDTYGHAQGDQLLGMVANRLRALAASESAGLVGDQLPIVGRLAGDEFTLMFTGVNGEEGVTRIARGLLAALNEPFELAGHTLDVGASIGVAMRPDAGHTLTALMRAADVAMYHAKASGRGQYQFYSEALAERLVDRDRLDVELRQAIDRNEFALWVQPQLSLVDGRVSVGEVLLRWNHPVDGVRTPGQFMAAAEESGLIFEVGDWSIEAVTRMAGEWAKRGIDQRLAVNLSPRQISRADFFPRVRESMVRHGIVPSMIEFEIAESLALTCGEAVIREIAQLRREGAIVAIDDFGAGISNLPRLRQLPIDRVKIDGSLIANIAIDADARTIVQAVIGLIHGLGYQSVAEGVETDEQIEVLRVMGCHAVQGYAIARPMAEADYFGWSAGALADQPKTRARISA